MSADWAGLVNINIYASPEWGPWRVDIDATFMDDDYARLGIPLAIFWRLPAPDFPQPVRYARVNNKTARWAGREELDVEALDLWHIGDSLIDFIPQALDTLDEIYEHFLRMRDSHMELATEYAIARLDKTAHLRTKPHTPG
jgi:hypothetical protein